MAVNINGLDLSGTSASSTPPRAPTAQSTSTIPPDATQQHHTSVGITSTASLLARLQQVLAASSAVDQGRVDAISRALATGSYKVSGDNIAQGLINTERALGQLDSSEF
jgi:flagellar biosynthesis anti-sigma factor FlgM